MLVSFFWMLCTASHIENLVKEPMYSRKSGPIYQKLNSYKGAAISALYSIPCVQKAFYEEYVGITPESLHSAQERAVVSFMAENMAKMRTGHGNNLEYRKKTTTNEFRVFEEYWIELLASCPKSIQRLFTFRMQTEIIRSYDSFILNRLAYERNHKSLYVNSDLKSVSQYIENCFTDEVSNKKAQQAMKLDYPIQFKNTFESNPEVLTFRMSRFTQSNPNDPISFDESPFVIEEEILLNQVLYILIARIEFDPKTGFYSTVARDLGDSKIYKYDDNGYAFLNSESTESKFIDYKSVMLFYIPKIAVESINLFEYQNLIDLPLSLSFFPAQQTIGTKRSHQEISKTTKSISITTDLTIIPVNHVVAPVQDSQNQILPVGYFTSELNEKLKNVYKPDYDLYPKYKQGFADVEKFLKEKIAIWPIKFADFYAKIAYQVFPLGSLQYSFKVGYAGLEIVLTALASNLKAVSKLFSKFETSTPNSEIEKQLAVVIVKMLLGCKNISLEKLIAAAGTLGPFFNVNYDVKQKDYRFKKVIQSIISVIPNYLLSFPVMNIIRYSGLESDDPVQVSSQIPHSMIKLDDIIKPREAFIRGVWFDSFEVNFSRKRTIYKSDSEIFIVEVSRWKKPGTKQTFYSANLEIKSEDYECVGVVTLGEFANEFESFFVDKFCVSNRAYRAFKPGKESVTYAMSEANNEHFEKACKSESILLFYAKKSVENPENAFSRAIPKYLKKIVLSDYAKELKVQLP